MIPLLILLTALPEVRLERTRVGRVGRPWGGVPLLSFAPASGAGMSTPCACTAVTGSKGEALTLTRNSVLDCRKGGPSVTSGIAVGDIVQCAVNTPRVELMPDGVTKGVEQWHSFVQSALRTDELENAAWTSVEAVTANAATAPNNTVTADQLNDTSAAALRCTTQTIATTSQTRHQVSVYVRAGTATSATISLTGTGNSAGNCSATATGLSTTTWNRLWCPSGAAYGAGITAVTVAVCVGTTASDTGTLMAWRFNHHVASAALGIGYPSPSVQAVAASVTVPVETPTITLGSGVSQTRGSVAVTFAPAWASTASTSTAPAIGTNVIYFDSTARPAYSAGYSSGAVRIFDGTNDVSHTPTAWSAGASVRVWASWTGSTLTISGNGATATTGSFDGTMGAGSLTSFQIANTNTTASIAGVFALVCADSDPLRCR